MDLIADVGRSESVLTIQMSSPLTTVINVTYNLLEQATALRRAIRRYRESCHALDSVATEAVSHETALGEALGVTTPQTASVGGAALSVNDLEFENLTGSDARRVRRQVDERLGELDQAIRANRQVLSHARQEISHRANQIRRRQVMDSLQAVAHDIDLPESTTRSESSDRRVLDEIDGVLSRLGPATTDERVEVEELARRATEAEGPAQAALIARMRTRVQDIGVAARQCEAERGRAERMRDRIRGLEGAEVDQVDAALAAVEQGRAELDPNLIAVVGDLEERLRRHQNAEYAASVLEDGLRELGYVVDRDFVTVLVGEGQADFRRSEWSDHTMRVRLDEEGKTLNFNLVQRGAVGASAAASVETEFCEQLPELLGAIEQPGLEVQVTRRIDPGSLPPEAETAPTAQKGSRRRRRPLRRRVLDD